MVEVPDGYWTLPVPVPVICEPDAKVFVPDSFRVPPVDVVKAPSWVSPEMWPPFRLTCPLSTSVVPSLVSGTVTVVSAEPEVFSKVAPARFLNSVVVPLVWFRSESPGIVQVPELWILAAPKIPLERLIPEPCDAEAPAVTSSVRPPIVGLPDTVSPAPPEMTRVVPPLFGEAAPSVPPDQVKEEVSNVAVPAIVPEEAVRLGELGAVPPKSAVPPLISVTGGL